MFEAHPCSIYWPGQFAQLYAILKSDGWHFVFAFLAAARAIAYYCAKSRYLEAREVASAMIMASILVVLIVAGELQVPTLVRQILSCKAPETQEKIAVVKVERH